MKDVTIVAVAANAAVSQVLPVMKVVVLKYNI
jgi:hypothetical protein